MTFKLSLGVFVLAVASGANYPLSTQPDIQDTSNPSSLSQRPPPRFYLEGSYGISRRVKMAWTIISAIMGQQIRLKSIGVDVCNPLVSATHPRLPPAARWAIAARSNGIGLREQLESGLPIEPRRHIQAGTSNTEGGAQFLSIVVRLVSSLSATKMASTLAGRVVLAFSLRSWCAPGFSVQLSPA